MKCLSLVRTFALPMFVFLSANLTGCLLDPQDPAEAELEQSSAALRLMQNDNGECAYAGTVTCTHAAWGTQTYSHTEYAHASEFRGGTCPSLLEVSWERDGWSCKGMMQPKDPIEDEVAEEQLEEKSLAP